MSNKLAHLPKPKFKERQYITDGEGQSFLSPTANIELQGRIDPIYPFVIPTVAHRSNPMITLPEANGRVFGG
ncbi:hypothetical protein [Rhodohalobacter halophilus]|uniref:hypothetical protein n=1 Tax=Rhodohalobacter halophilus TaxID=1812810 RepID=UPI00114D133C|nr:hypothetical protein [Rhodohalobacter halophilus]